jgi:hypothetical protein
MSVTALCAHSRSVIFGSKECAGRAGAGRSVRAIGGPRRCAEPRTQPPAEA